jgi:hypothetical protein
MPDLLLHCCLNPLVFLGVVLIAVPLGLAGLAIGLVTMFGLPKELGLSHQTLLYDRSATND